MRLNEQPTRIYMKNKIIIHFVIDSVLIFLCSRMGNHTSVFVGEIGVWLVVVKLMRSKLIICICIACFILFRFILSIYTIVCTDV